MKGRREDLNLTVVGDGIGCGKVMKINSDFKFNFKISCVESVNFFATTFF